MEKNKRLLIIVGVLLLFGGIALAYYVGKTLLEGNGASVKVITANIKNSELRVEGTLEFENYPDMLPGHKQPSAIKVTAIGDNELIPYNVVWNGTNGLGTPLNFTIYKVSKELEIKAKCEQQSKRVDGGTAIFEECSITNEESLGTPIGSGTISANSGATSVVLATDEFITSTEEPGTEVYYYVILEYPNINGSQNTDMGENFDGEVNIKPSDITPDIEITAMYQKGEDGTYEEVDSIPSEGYTLNVGESSCNNGITPAWDDDNYGLLVKSLNKSGTECELYFDKQIFAKDTIIDNSNYHEDETPNFDGTACIGDCTYQNENGLYKTQDDFGDSYYFRGTVNDNWVKFGTTSDDKDIYWRIIRINGDGTIRLIYSGSGSPEKTGVNTQIDSSYFNSYINNNMYVGYEYKLGDMHGYKIEITKSIILQKLNDWFSKNLLEEWKDGEGQMDKNAGFCNDRSGSNNNETSWSDTMPDSGGTGTTNTFYGAYLRLTYKGDSPTINNPANPTLKCSTNYNKNKDYFTYENATGIKQNGEETKITGTQSLDYPVGLITADEATFAGGKTGINNSTNKGYWLYTNQYYWTMTPYYFYSDASYMFNIEASGQIHQNTSVASYGIRPVINLKAKTELTFEHPDQAGKGTSENPYIVKGVE